MITPQQQKFLYDVLLAAKASELKTKIPAAFTTAEAILESGWGADAPGMNLFGVKADASWTGPCTTERTREFVNGAPVIIEAKFRAYTDWQGSIDDHAVFLIANPRYAPAFKTVTAIDFTRAVAAAGYATDPQYADKIIQVIRQHNIS